MEVLHGGEYLGYKEQGNTVNCSADVLLNIYGVISEQSAIGSPENIQTLQYWIVADVLNAKDESIVIHKEVLDKSVVSNIKTILMSRNKGMELKRLQLENKYLQKYMVS